MDAAGSELASRGGDSTYPQAATGMLPHPLLLYEVLRKIRRRWLKDSLFLTFVMNSGILPKAQAWRARASL
jgi:hypothetical protein